MKIQITAKTVSDAVDEALIKFDTTIDNIDYRVIQEPSKGFFGIGTKSAIIEVWVKEEEKKPEDINIQDNIKDNIQTSAKTQTDSFDVKEDTRVESDNFKNKDIKVRTTDPCKVAEKFLNDVFAAMKMNVSVETELVDNKYLNINLKGDEMGVIIGKRGQTLDSLQYLVNLSVNKGESPYISVNLDTEEYRKRRKETLENLAYNLAKKAKHLRKNVVLEPMNPYERRIIHSTLQNDKYVTTYSEGVEPFRYVVIAPKKYY